MERLQKVMAKAGVASRRHSEELILRGSVSVDGRVVREMGYKVDPLVSKIEVMGKVLDIRAPRSYIMLNKPTGVLTTVSDPFKRPTVMDFFGDDFVGIFPVGRLDQDTSGLLLMTNDGELAFRLTHPKHKIAKVYLARVKGPAKSDEVWSLRQGISLEDGPTQPARVRIISRGENTTDLEIAIFEGRKRQVRRMCQAIRHPVITLERLEIGPLKLGDLPPGQWRPLTEWEETLLKDATES